jgi:hypothetical protein
MSNKFFYTKKIETNSSFSRAVYYNEASHELAFYMTNGGFVVYVNVPGQVFDNLAKSNSIGSYYNDNIKNVFKNKFGQTVYSFDVQKADNEVQDVTKATKANVFVVTGVETKEVQASILASSMDEAIKIFQNSHRDALVKEVTLKIV